MTTIKDVAKLAQVSASTVSRALSGKSYVDEATRERILRAVAQLDYRPNNLARGLKEGSTRMLGLLIPDIQNPIFPLLVRGAENQARREGYNIILCNTDEDPRIERQYMDTLRNLWADGLLIAPTPDSAAQVEALAQSGYPVVSLIRRVGDLVDSVTVDNFEGARNAVAYLIQRGCRKIALVSGPRKLDLYRQRYEGYLAALQDAGLPADEHLVIDSAGMGTYTAMLEFLRHGHSIDGVFAASDPRAIHAAQAIKDFGLAIPADISVVGFDNLEIAALVDPPLTTVSQPLYEIGQTAVKTLLRRIAACKSGDPLPPEHRILKTELSIKKSTK